MAGKWRYIVLIILLGVSLTERVFAAATASVTIGGAEQYSASAGVWDSGTVTVSVNGYPETVPYGTFSTPTSIASALGAKFSQDCNSPANARGNGAVLSFQGKGTVADLVLQFSTARNTAVFSQDSFEGDGLPGSTLSGPMITGITPNSGTTGRSVTITGTDFGSSGTITFNGTAATASLWTNTSITTTVPANATTGPVVVTVSGTSSNGILFRTPLPASCPAN